MKFAFIDAEKAQWPVVVLCAVLGVSTSGFYAWLARPPSKRLERDRQLTADLRAIHKRSRGTYGSPRAFRALKAKGTRVGRKRVERLMRADGLVAKRKRRFRATTNSKHTNPIAPNSLNRQFNTDAPNAVWVTDVTYVWTLEGWLYLAVMLDLYSRRVVGWSVSASNDRHLALDAWNRACALRQPQPGLVHHSDRGSPYASEDYRQALKDCGALASMSRKGDCWDNAVAESFFGTIKGELTDHELYTTRQAAIDSIGDYIDNFYNVERIHSSIGNVSPIEFELRQLSREAA